MSADPSTAAGAAGPASAVSAPPAARIAVVSSQEMAHPDPEAPSVAEALRAAGADVDLVSWHGERDWAAYDLVLVRSPWDYFDHLGAFLAWADHVASVTRLVNPAEVIRWNSHKGYLPVMGERGVPVLPALVVPAGAADVVERLRATGWDDVVLKPAVDGGARAMLRGLAAAPEVHEHARAVVARGDLVVQPYAAQIELGETSLLYFGGGFSHAVRKVPAPGDFRVQQHHGGREHPHDPSPRELEVAEQAMACAPGRLTYARVDLVDIGGVPTLMELEVIEPDLFLRFDDQALGRLTTAVLAELAVTSVPRHP